MTFCRAAIVAPFVPFLAWEENKREGTRNALIEGGEKGTGGLLSGPPAAKGIAQWQSPVEGVKREESGGVNRSLRSRGSTSPFLQQQKGWCARKPIWGRGGGSKVKREQYSYILRGKNEAPGRKKRIQG